MLTATDFDYVRRLVLERSAILLEPGKEYLVELRLKPIVRMRGLRDLGELVQLLRTDVSGSLQREVVEAMTTNETSFFRDVHPFETLRQWVLPELLRNRAAERVLNIWCGAASSGQEVYSIAMTLREHFPELAHWRVSIVATDLSREMILRCREARYSQLEINRGLPANLLIKYFERADMDWRIREDVRFTLTLDPPDEEQCCETCCCSCGDACLVLAAIRLDPGKALGNGAIDQSVRRPIGLYQPVVITGVSWQHGASYDAKTANQILGTKDESGGLLIKFSRPVHVSTLLPGVIEIWRVAGGRGVSGIVTGVDGEYVGLPASGFVSEVRYRDTTGETVQGRDRIIVVVKGDFILDRCCRPVAAANIGGRVPALPEAPQPLSAPDFAGICSTPPAGRMAWTSGHGGVFESWFTVAED